ncbi:hypothetical protein [Litchfieldia alkalitelluris]|nr:hypothetical protein [Litchfieldia alkalitelluris]
MMLLVESLSGHRYFVIPQGSSEVTIFTSGLLPFLFVTVIIGCFYVITYLETKKNNRFFSSKVWNKMPAISFAVLVISIFQFMLFLLLGPGFEWIEEWRILLYFSLCFFLFLYFIFIYSMVHKFSDSSTSAKKKVHYSFLWSNGLLFGALFLI